MERKSQLVLELFREFTRLESFQDAGQELRPVCAAQLDVLQAAAHHRPCPAMPMALRFSENERNAVLNGHWLLSNQLVRQRMKLSL